MGLIDFILNLAALLLWLNWRSLRFDPLVRSRPASLIGTLRRAEPRRLRGWQVLLGVFGLLVLRAWLYWEIGSPANWTPKLNLGFVTPVFRSDIFLRVLVYSFLSFLRVLVIFYFWLIVLTFANRGVSEPDPIQRLLRLHLGRVAQWPLALQAALPFLLVAVFWIACHPLLLHLGVVNPIRSTVHLVEQGLLISTALLVTLKFVIPPFFCLYLVASYIYLGSNPFWDFVCTTSRNLLGPLKSARFAKLDLAPVAGVALVFLLLHWLPNFVLGVLAEKKFEFWPQ